MVGRIYVKAPVISNMMTTTDTVICMIPLSAAPAPRKAYVPGVMHGTSVCDPEPAENHDRNKRRRRLGWYSNSHGRWRWHSRLAVQREYLFFLEIRVWKSLAGGYNELLPFPVSIALHSCQRAMPILMSKTLDAGLEAV